MSFHNETGRSMIEMLGTLAVVGVLSVMGIVGYTSIMTKHRANELLNKINMMATSVATQIMLGAAPSVADFSKGFPGCEDCEFSVQKLEDTNRFLILVHGHIPKGICEKVLDFVGPKTLWW